jgi:hypothetical protein
MTELFVHYSKHARCQAFVAEKPWLKKASTIMLFALLVSLFPALLLLSCQIQGDLDIPFRTITAHNSENARYRAVILVLASAKSPLDVFFKEVWMAYMNCEPRHIKVYFVYGSHERVGLKNESWGPNDLVYDDIPEQYPVPIAKVVKALKYIDAKHEYDFLVRTNLSTFWVLQNLLRILDDLPTRLCYFGDGPLPPSKAPAERYYLSGIDTIVNRYMVSELVQYAEQHPEWADLLDPEDKQMGLFFHGILGAPLRPSSPYFMEHYASEDSGRLAEDIRSAMLRKATHFRVKSAAENRLLVDSFIMRGLLRHYYRLNFQKVT